MHIVAAVLSLLGLTVPAGVSQTAFAQSIAEQAVDGTVLEGFFDGEDDDSIGGGGHSDDPGGGDAVESVGGGGGRLTGDFDTGDVERVGGSGSHTKGPGGNSGE